MQQAHITLHTPSEPAMKAYTARPDHAPGAPGVVVIHEIWGVDAHIRSVVDRLAEAGFAAIAPDLLGLELTVKPATLMQAFGAVRQLAPEDRAVPEKVREALSGLPEGDREECLALMARAFRGATPEGLQGIDAAVRYLREHGAAKVAVTGFCLGGRYTWAHAYAGGDADAFAPFYGALPEHADPARVKAPIQGHFGSEDHGIPVPPLEEAAAALRERGLDARIYVYDGAPHAFFNETRDSYRPEAAKLAWDRLLAFLREKLA